MQRTNPIVAALLLSSAWLYSSCSHTHTVTFDAEKPKGDTVSVGTLNDRLADRSGLVVARNGKEFAVSDVFLTRDSCLFSSDSGRGYMPTSDVLSIKRVDHVTGAIGGFAVGLGSGLILGYGVAKVAQAESGDSMSGMVGIVPMVLGPVIGLGVGAAVGTRTEYQLPDVIPDSSQTRVRAD